MIDSHCHLYFSKLKIDIENIILRSIENNVTAILSINTQFKDFQKHYKIIEKYQSVFISAGQHPEYVNFSDIISKNEILDICNNYDKVIAIGETGIDLYHSDKNLKHQIKAFENHIEASYESDLPLIIHQRNSENEIIEIIKYYQKYKKMKIVFHCFTGSNKLKNFCLDNEFYMSLSGIVTFKNAKDLRDVIKDIPIKNILLETDSPFLSPVPFRGKTNEPSFVKHTLEYLSIFYNISKIDIENITDNNFYDLFSKAKRYNKISI